MGNRVVEDSILWVCCCCGCLPIFGIYKSILIMPVSIIILVPSCFVIAFIMLPHDLFYTYYTVFVTTHYGPNLKVLATLLLWACFIAWPLIVLCSATIFAIGLGIFWAFTATFDDKYNLFIGGIWEGYQASFKYVGEFWKFNANSYFAFLKDFREPLPDGQKPFDINFIQIIVGLFVCIIAIIVDFPVFTVISLLFIVPLIFKAYYLWFKFVGDGLKNEPIMVCACFPFLIISFVLVPVVVIVGCIGISIGSIGLGPYASVTAYNDGLPAAYKKIFIEWFQELLEMYTKALTQNV